MEEKHCHMNSDLRATIRGAATEMTFQKMATSVMLLYSDNIGK